MLLGETPDAPLARDYSEGLKVLTTEGLHCEWCGAIEHLPAIIKVRRMKSRTRAPWSERSGGRGRGL